MWGGLGGKHAIIDVTKMIGLVIQFYFLFHVSLLDGQTTCKFELESGN